MADKDYYAPGTYNDPNAPWNEPDYSDEIIEYQNWLFRARLDDEPDAWISEGICEQAGKQERELYQWVIDNLKRGRRMKVDDTLLGKYVRRLVETYAMPSDQEAHEAVTEELANKMGDYYED
jgi:hypothetical protein